MIFAPGAHAQLHLCIKGDTHTFISKTVSSWKPLKTLLAGTNKGRRGGAGKVIFLRWELHMKQLHEEICPQIYQAGK